MDEIKGLDYGYAEMFEFDEDVDKSIKIGRFVQFSDKKPEMISLYHGGTVLGITCASAAIISNNPTEWQYKDAINEYGDKLLTNETLSVGNKVYDHNKEMAFIRTFKWDHLVTIPTGDYDSTKNYVMRTNRPEWVRVNLMGRAFVKDNGKCKAGEFCMPYFEGNMKADWGIAVPYDGKSKNKYYVLGRFTNETIIVLNKNMYVSE